MIRLGETWHLKLSEVTLLHNKARLHVIKTAKEIVEPLRWEELSHLAYASVKDSGKYVNDWVASKDCIFSLRGIFVLPKDGRNCELLRTTILVDLSIFDFVSTEVHFLEQQDTNF